MNQSDVNDTTIESMDITSQSQSIINASQSSIVSTEADESEGELSGPLVIDEEKPMKAPTPKRKLIDSVNKN